MAESLLMAVREKAKAYAMMIAEVLRLDVEVVDDMLVRVAGTGSLKDAAPLVSDGVVYRQILLSGKPAIIHNPRKHEVCAGCASRDRCLEKLEICYPITFEGGIVGAVGMACSSMYEKNVLMENIRTHISFISKACDMLSDSVAVARELSFAQKENAAHRAALARYAEEGYTGEVCSLEALEKREIEKALRCFGSDTKGKRLAAEALGIGVATLYRKLGNIT